MTSASRNSPEVAAMSVVEEQRQVLAQMHQRNAGRPRAEMAELLLLALEREEIVAVAFRESLILRRLASMPIPPEAADLIRHALVWIWKDEEMHSLYVRGALMRLGSAWLKWRAAARQLAGIVGGWSSSVRQHLRWRDAPLSRLAASAVVAAGRLGGQIPREILPHLDHNPFSRFCDFNADVERAACETWQHIVNVFVRQGDAAPDVIRDLERITQDEDNHGRVFRAFADELDGSDRLRDGRSIDRLAEKIGAVGAYFLPRRLRPGMGNHPVGGGGEVHVAEGASASDKLPVFRRLLERSGLAPALARRAEEVGRPVGELRVLIKANFMYGYSRADPSPVVDPALVEELARFLTERGCRGVGVAETCNRYDQFFDRRGVREVAEYHGLRSPHYQLLDLSADRVSQRYDRGYGQYEISRAWKEADFRVTFGKLASHPVELVHLSLKNLQGVGGRADRYFFRERQANYATAVVMLCDEFPPHFALVEGYDHAPDGMMGFIGCPRPPALRRVYAGADSLAVDLTVMRHLNLPLRLSHALQTAAHWFGDPTPRTKVVGVDEAIRGWRSPRKDDVSTLLSLLSFPVFECCSGRGSLFVPEMDERAFPPRQAPGWTCGASRNFSRWLCGIRLGRRAPPPPAG
jgi:uncharacterized protein (DUF362 family)